MRYHIPYMVTLLINHNEEKPILVTQRVCVCVYIQYEHIMNICKSNEFHNEIYYNVRSEGKIKLRVP